MKPLFIHPSEYTDVCLSLSDSHPYSLTLPDTDSHSLMLCLSRRCSLIHPNALMYPGDRDRDRVGFGWCDRPTLPIPARAILRPRVLDPSRFMVASVTVACLRSRGSAVPCDRVESGTRVAADSEARHRKALECDPEGASD